MAELHFATSLFFFNEGGNRMVLVGVLYVVTK